MKRQKAKGKIWREMRLRARRQKAKVAAAGATPPPGSKPIATAPLQQSDIPINAAAQSDSAAQSGSTFIVASTAIATDTSVITTESSPLQSRAMQLFEQRGGL